MKIDCDCGKTLMACQVPEPQPGQRHIGICINVAGPGQAWQLVCQSCKREIILVQYGATASVQTDPMSKGN